jgi:SAM-dependent methyltransferase
VTDIFTDAGAYEKATGRHSRQFGRQFVPWMAARRDARWLDAGCGTGALTQAIIDLAWPGEVVAVDTSDAYLEFATRTVAGVRFQRASITELPFDGGYFDAVVSGLVLHHLKDPQAAVAEMARVTAPGAQVGVYVWDRDERQNAAYWRAVSALDGPPANTPDAGGKLGRVEDLSSLLAGAGLMSVQSTRLEATVDYTSFEDWWDGMMGRRGFVHQHFVALTPEWQAKIRDRARAETGGGGAFRETAAAWAVRGRK